MHRGGEGAPLSWPREKEGVGSGGACLAQQMGIIWGRQEGALGAMVGTGLHLPRTGGSGTGPLRLSMQSGPRLRGGAAGSLPSQLDLHWGGGQECGGHCTRVGTQTWAWSSRISATQCHSGPHGHGRAHGKGAGTPRGPVLVTVPL